MVGSLQNVAASGCIWVGGGGRVFTIKKYIIGSFGWLEGFTVYTYWLVCVWEKMDSLNVNFRFFGVQIFIKGLFSLTSVQLPKHIFYR